MVDRHFRQRPHHREGNHCSCCEAEKNCRTGELHANGAAAEKTQAAVAIDIQLHGFPLFSHAMAGTTPDNLEWIRRKRNVVTRYHRSSYAIGLKHERANTTLQGTTGLELKDYSTHGGSFPIFVAGTGC